jgi:hypothetical protein
MPAANNVPAQDYVEISNLYAYYNLCSDAGDPEGYASCFTEDGLLNLVTLGFTRRGRATLEAFKAADAAGRNGRYRRHWNGSLHLEAKPDGSVEGRCYFVAGPVRRRPLRRYHRQGERRLEVRRTLPDAGRHHLQAAGLTP